MITIIEGLTILTAVIGSATLIFRGLLILTQYTKTLRDDKIVSKILKVLQFISGNVSKIEQQIVVKTRR